MGLTIREIGVEEIQIISDLSFKIWPISYANVISSEQIQYMLDWMYSEASLRENINEGHRFFLAENAGVPIGFIGFQLHYPKVDGAKIHKLYVLTDTHHKGTGRALCNLFIQECIQNHCKHIELQVNKKNTAIEFYKKLGFYIGEEAIFEIGNGFIMDDYIMRYDV